jgi:glycosyltransferase involved in cell wall biosynthesis
MNVLVTNVPATYRTDFYNRLGRCGWRMFFYAREERSLSYCADQRPLEFPHDNVTLVSLAWRLVRCSPETVVCINASLYTMVCALYSALFRKKFTVWWAGTAQSERFAGPWRMRFRRIVFHLADDFIAYSDLAADYLTDIGVDASRITLLGNLTLDPQAFRARVQAAKPGESARPLTLLSVGMLVKRKNHAFLLKVYERIRGRFPGLRLLIVGEGPERGSLEAMIRALNTDSVVLMGHVGHDDMPSVYAMADLMIHPASMDQWPQCVNEAMAAGVPVVASSASGLSTTLLRDREDLLIVDLDVDLFAEEVAALLEDGARRRAIGARGQQRAVELFHIAVSVFEKRAGRPHGDAR